MSDTKPNSQVDRRGFMKAGAACTAMFGLGIMGGKLGRASASEDTLWQIDPYKCTMCGKCETHCVLKPSAVKCFHAFADCGYCRLCTGYFLPDAPALTQGAENQLCPTDAIRRKFIEDPYYEYTIDHDLCIGCARCVDGCMQYGNGSLFLQISHDICVNCNECEIAKVCEGDAIHRVPVSKPYQFKLTSANPDQGKEDHAE